ncbi:MAG: DnaB-like helicase N-terminal domain-containing protein [Vicinamibacterales bacterium]
MAEQSSERVSPHDLEAERAVLGAVLVDGDTYATAAAIVTPETYYRRAHREIWRAIVALRAHGEPADLVTVCGELARIGQLDSVGGPAYVAALVDGVPLATNVAAYARTVRDMAARRALAVEAAAIIEQVHTGDAPADIIETAVARLDGVRTRLEGRRKLTPVSAADLVDASGPREIVEGIVWATCITTLVAESGAGKSFFALDLAGAVSDGVTFHGRDVSSGSVVYIPFEADDLGRRIRALRDVTGRRLEHLYVVPARDALSPAIDRDRVETSSRGELDLRAAIVALRDRLAREERPAIVLIVVDTVRASMSGSEDSSEAVSAYLRAVRRVMADIPTAACLAVHHTGWLDGEAKRKRERGSSAFRGNGDAALYLEADGEYDRDRGEQRLVLTSLKVRDAEQPPPLRLVRRRVELAGIPHDIRRGPATSCVIEADRRTRQDREADARQATAAADRALDLRVLRVLADHGGTATSMAAIAGLVGVRSLVVQTSLPRLVTAGWVTPPERQRQPYRVTEAGLHALNLSQSESVPSRSGTESGESVPAPIGAGLTHSPAGSGYESVPGTESTRVVGIARREARRV